MDNVTTHEDVRPIIAATIAVAETIEGVPEDNEGHATTVEDRVTRSMRVGTRKKMRENKLETTATIRNETTNEITNETTIETTNETKTKTKTTHSPVYHLSASSPENLQIGTRTQAPLTT